MPTRNINLTPEQDAFVEKVVEAGEYQDASEAIRDALGVLQQRRREDALKLEALRAQLHLGVAALERGDFIEFERSRVRQVPHPITTAEKAYPLTRWLAFVSPLLRRAISNDPRDQPRSLGRTRPSSLRLAPLGVFPCHRPEPDGYDNESARTAESSNKVGRNRLPWVPPYERVHNAMWFRLTDIRPVHPLTVVVSPTVI